MQYDRQDHFADAGTGGGAKRARTRATSKARSRRSQAKGKRNASECSESSEEEACDESEEAYVSEPESSSTGYVSATMSEGSEVSGAGEE